jgi:DNA polymerase-1
MVYGERLNFIYEDMILVIKEKAAGGKKHPRYKEFKRMRANIKTTTFGVPYGSGAKGVAARCGITEEEAQQVIDDFFKQFPVLKEWLNIQGNRAILEKNTETPYQRKRFYEIPLRSDEHYDVEIRQVRRWAGNHPIQAASADMLKEALRRIYSRIRGGILNGPKLYDARIIMVVHDEIVVMSAEKDAKAVAIIMEKCMGEAYDMIIGDAIPNEVEVCIEDQWEKV